MRVRVSCVVIAVLLAIPTSALAQDMGSGQGRYATFNTVSDTTAMPDGRSVMVSHYGQVVFADAPDHPLDGQMADCVGLFVVSADGAIVAASGSCYSQDAAGDGLSYWWRMEKGGTADCPDLCGSYGYFAGYGKYQGITGAGNWERQGLVADGSVGVWDGTYSMR